MINIVKQYIIFKIKCYFLYRNLMTMICLSVLVEVIKSCAQNQKYLLITMMDHLMTFINQSR